MSDFKVGDFVKYSSLDKKHPFTYTGGVTEVQGVFITIETQIGRMTFKKEPDTEIEAIETPAWWEKFIKDPDKFKQKLYEKSEKKKEESKLPPPKSDKEIVLEVVKANPKLTESKLLKLIQPLVKTADKDRIKAFIGLAKLKI